MLAIPRSRGATSRLSARKVVVAIPGRLQSNAVNSLLTARIIFTSILEPQALSRDVPRGQSATTKPHLDDPY